MTNLPIKTIPSPFFTGAEGIARILLQKGANVDALDNEGDSALSFAALNSYENIMKMLLEHGANVNIVGYDGRTTLMLSVASGSEEIISTLIDRGAKVNAVNNNGESVLDAAFDAIEGIEKEFKILMKIWLILLRLT